MRVHTGVHKAPLRSRRPTTSVAALDAAASEVASALTAVTAASAMVLALGSAIRQANRFDVHEMEKAVPAAAAEPTVAGTPSPDVLPSPVVTPSSDVEHVRSWIASWREKSQSQSSEHVSEEPDNQTSNAVTAAQEWISSWRNKASASAQQDARANPAAAAAVLDSLSSNTPVGATASQNSQTTSTLQEEKETLAVASTSSSATQKDVNDRETEATTQNAGSQRVVTVPDQYQNKIDSLWASYEEKKAKQSELLKRQEKITMDIAALEAVSEKVNMQAQKPKVNIIRQFIDILAGVWAFIKNFIANVMGGLGRSGPSGQSA